MEPFLKQVVNHLYSKYNEDIQDVCLIFPGRRAGLFFLQHYKELAKEKPLWAPTIKTISELISELSHLQVADPIVLNFELFKVYKAIRTTDEDFDSFYPFGEMLLGDFNDVDKYLADTRQLFQNISDLRDIENKFSLSAEQIELIQQFWKNINLFEPGPFKKNFIGIWNQLLQIYENFNQVLTNKGIAYEGMMYRMVCEKIKDQTINDNLSGKYAIIGFNALNECEKIFFEYLQKHHKVDFYWDYDNYYVKNTWHEAGFFIRQNLDKFPNSLAPDKFSGLSTQKNIQVISAPTDIGQAKLIPAILGSIAGNDNNLNDTIIVLADEQLLIPVLSSLPENIKDVNVTLGYPFRLTHVYGFLELIIRLRKNTRASSETNKFYHNDVQALLNHPYCRIICNDICTEIITDINKNNKIYISQDELNKNNYLGLIFQNNDTITGFINNLSDIGNETIQKLQEQEHNGNIRVFHLEYWFSFLSATNKLKEIIAEESINIGFSTLYRLLRKIFSGLSTPFKGEPLAGMQIMGVLETRAIDFSNVIILSANEGIFPKTEASASYIPYNLRKGFGLPTIEHQDAIYAYYFYRLLQRAKNVTITYSSQQINRNNEMSRFIYQLRYESTFDITEKSVGFSIHLPYEHNIAFLKNKQILNILNNYTPTAPEPKYLTPTALSAYMECSLRFYFRYIAQLKEKEQITDEIESSVFGKLLHFSMEKLYKPYEDKLVTPEIIENISQLNNIENAVIDAFASEHFIHKGSKELLHGKSILIKEILVKYISEILKKDKKIAPFTIVALEKHVGMEFPIGTIIVNIGGIIDRIDKLNGALRIIDYKTGQVEYNCADIESIFDRENDTHKYSPIFQSMLYAIVLGTNTEYNTMPVYPGLYGLRKIFQNDFDCSITINKEKVTDIKNHKDTFEGQLSNIISELFNPNIPFTKTTDKKKCENCAYREICAR